jgi:hypothetical protein
MTTKSDLDGINQLVGQALWWPSIIVINKLNDTVEIAE